MDARIFDLRLTNVNLLSLLFILKILHLFQIKIIYDKINDWFWEGCTGNSRKKNYC